VHVLVLVELHHVLKNKYQRKIILNLYIQFKIIDKSKPAGAGAAYVVACAGAG
jgi:hypothetical protein